MGNYSSSPSLSHSSSHFEVSGGARKALEHMSLKDMQNKIVQLFSHIGIMNKNTDLKQFLKSIAENTNPSIKELNSSKNKEAIENLKDFMVEGLGMEYLKDIKDPMIVLKTGFQLLNSLVHGMSLDLSKFRSNLEVNVDGMSKLLEFTNNLVSKYKKLLADPAGNDVPSHKVNKVLSVLEHLVKMLKTQKDFISILLNSAQLKETEVNLEKLADKDYEKETFSGLRVTDAEVSKLIMSLLNDLSKGGYMIADIKNIQKLAKDKHLDIPSKSIPELEKLIKNHDMHLKDNNLENITEWINTLYRIIEEKRKEAIGHKKKKGGNDYDVENMLLSKNSSVLSSLVQDYLGSSEEPLHRYGGVDTLKNSLKYKTMARGADKSRIFMILAKNFNKELLKLGDILSHLQKYISATDYKLNEDLERYVKRFLIFQSFRTKAIYLALVGYFSDVQSRFLREDFLIKIQKLQLLSKEFISKHHHIKEVGEIEAQLKNIHSSISDLSSKFKEKFGGDTERFRHIEDVSVLDIPDLTDVNNKLIKNVIQTLYFIRLKNMTNYIKKFKLYQSDDYEKLVGKAIADDLDKVREDYKNIISALVKFEDNLTNPEASEVNPDEAVKLNNAIFIYYTKPGVDASNKLNAKIIVKDGHEFGVENEFRLIKKVFFKLPQHLDDVQLRDEENFIGLRDRCAWGRRGASETKWIPSESEDPTTNVNVKKLSGTELQQAIHNYKEFIKIYYESYINLAYAAQGLDQYLKHFSDKVRINPEIIEKLELLLENTNIGSVLFDRNQLPKMILDIMDPNEYHLPEVKNNSIHNENKSSSFAECNISGDGGRIDAVNMMPPDVFHKTLVSIKDRLIACDASGILRADSRYLEDLITCSERIKNNFTHFQNFNMTVYKRLLYMRILSYIAGPPPGGSAAAAARWMPNQDFGGLCSGTIINGAALTMPAAPNTLPFMYDFYFNNIPFPAGGEIAADNFASFEPILNPRAAGVVHITYTGVLGNRPAGARGNHIYPGNVAGPFNGGALMNEIEHIFAIYRNHTDNPALSLSNTNSWRMEHNYHYAYSDLKPQIDLLYNRVPSKKNRPTISNRHTLHYNASSKETREGYPFMIYNKEPRTDPQFNSPINKLLNTKEFYKNNTIIKNILSIFFNLLKDSFNEQKEQRFMEPKAILNAITNYLSLGIYKFTYTRPTHGMGRFQDKHSGSDTNSLNNVENLSLMSLIDNDNLSVFDERYTAMNLLDTNIRVGMVNNNDVDYDNFPETRETVYGKGHNLLMHMLKAITAKTLTILGLYDIRDYKNNKAYRVNLMDPTRVVLGGATRNYAIKDEYSEFYIRLPLLVEFYRMVFYDSMRTNINPSNTITPPAGDLITLLPELSEPFGSIFRHIFLYFNNKSVVDYNETEMKEIIADVNDIINYFKDKADKDVSLLKFVIYKMIEEVNHKYGALNRFEYNTYLQKTYEYLNLKHFNVSEPSGFDLIDDDLFDDNGIINDNIPSDLYSNKPELIDSTNIMVAPYKKFNISSDYQVLKQFRNRIFSLLLETAREDNFVQVFNTHATLFGLDDILSELKLTIKNSKNEQEKFKQIFKLISSTSSFKKMDTMKDLIMYEFVVTQLNVVENILFFLEQVRVRFSNQVTSNESRHLYTVLNSSFNGVHNRFILDKNANRLGNNAALPLDPQQVRMMGTLPGMSNLAALGINMYSVAAGGAAVPQIPNTFLVAPQGQPARPAIAAANPNDTANRIVENILRKGIDDQYTRDPNNFYFGINCILAQIHKCNIRMNQSFEYIPGKRTNLAFNVGEIYEIDNNALNINLILPGAVGFPLNRFPNNLADNYLNYYVDLIEHDVFKLVRKILLHPNLFDVNMFNSRVKIDASALELNIERQLNNLTQLFNDLKVNMGNNDLIAYTTSRLSDAYSKYEHLFKANISVTNIVNPYETFNQTVRNLEAFLNNEITPEHFSQTERNSLLPSGDAAWTEFYIRMINNLGTKFWNSFFISRQENYEGINVNKHKELLNHYRLVNVYGERVTRRDIKLSYPLDVFFETKGPRISEQSCDVNDLIFAEPHPDAFTSNGLFDVDIVSYFNHILGTFLKGCMNEDGKIYRLCPEYINYTSDTLDNVIDNRYVNIKKITYMSGGLNYADTIHNGIGYDFVGANNILWPNNIMPNILSPHLVSHKSLNEKEDDYFNLFDINIGNQYLNCFAFKTDKTLPGAAGMTFNSPGGGQYQINNNNIIGAVPYRAAGEPYGITTEDDTRKNCMRRFMRRFQIYSSNIEFVENVNNNFRVINRITQPLDKLRGSNLTPNKIINHIGAAGGALPAPTIIPSMLLPNTLTIFDNSNNLGFLGGLTLHAVTGDFYYNVDLRQRIISDYNGLFAPNAAGVIVGNTVGASTYSSYLNRIPNNVIKATMHNIRGSEALAPMAGYPALNPLSTLNPGGPNPNNYLENNAMFFPLDLINVANLLNFGNSANFADINNPLLNKNNFIDNNYLGVELKQIKQEATNNAVLLKSNATVLRNLLNNFDANKDVKRHLYENIAEIPQNTKDAMLGICNFTKHHINILQKLIKTLTNTRNYGLSQDVATRHKNICNNIFSHINALNKQIDIILLEMNDEKFNYGETNLDNFESVKNLTNSEPNISISTALFSQLTDFSQYPVLTTCDSEVKTSSENNFNTGLTGDSSIKANMFTMLNNKFYFGRNIDWLTRRVAGGGANIANIMPNANNFQQGKLNFANPININYTNLPAALFSVRKLYSANKLTINDFSYLKNVIKQLNASVDIKINESTFNDILSSMQMLKFCPEEDPFALTLAASYSQANTCNEKVDPYLRRQQPAPAALGVPFPPRAAPQLTSTVVARLHKTLSDYFKNNKSLLLSVEDLKENYDNNNFNDLTRAHRFTIQNIPFQLNSNNLKNDEMPFIMQIFNFLDRLYPKKDAAFNPFSNKDYLIRMNVLDLNIMPIDINAMSREIPLAYLFNYSSSFDDYLLDMTEGSIIDRQILRMRENSTNNRQINAIVNYCDKFFMDYTNVNNNDRYMLHVFDRNKRKLERNIITTNLAVFNTEEVDRLLHYNAFLKLVNNLNVSHSAYHVVNNLNFTPNDNNNCTRNYEHFMMNNKYKGCALNDNNAIRLRAANAHNNFTAAGAPYEQANALYYYHDLFKGIHKAPVSNGKGMFRHNCEYLNYNQAANNENTRSLVDARITPNIMVAVRAGGNNTFTINESTIRCNRTPDATEFQAYFPFDNLYGFSCLTGGDFTQSVTILPQLDMVKFLDDVFNRHLWNAGTNNNQFKTELVQHYLLNPRRKVGSNPAMDIVPAPGPPPINIPQPYTDALANVANYNTLINELQNNNNGAGGYEIHTQHNQYPHSDLNLGYLNRYHINHIGPLHQHNNNNDRYRALGNLAGLKNGIPEPLSSAEIAAGGIDALPGAPARRMFSPPTQVTQIDSVYQLFGKYDIRYFPRSFFTPSGTDNTEQNRRLARFAHVMSRFLYSENGFSFTFSRHLYFTNFVYNLIRHKIKNESLYNTNKVIQGKLFYQDEYDQHDRVMQDQFSLLKHLPRVPLNYDGYANPNTRTMDALRF